MVYNIGLESGACFLGKQCNSYLVTGDKNIIIDTVPPEFENELLNAVEKHISVDRIDCVFLLSAVPERAGALRKLLALNPGITVCATAAGLRNFSGISDLPFKSRICKNGGEITLGNAAYVTYITPNLTSPDAMMVMDKESGFLYTGELFSEVDGAEAYFNEYLRCYVPYVERALELVKSIAPKTVYPAYGVCTDVAGSIALYDSIVEKETKGEYVIVAYSSRTGNNKALALLAAEEINKKGIETKLFSLDTVSDSRLAARQLNGALGLVLGCSTENRTMPPGVWDFISGIDVNPVSGKPYIVFGSYGWSCEGAYMANELLSMLKMRRVCKFCECVFTPGEEDKTSLRKCVGQLVDFISKQKEKSSNA